MDREYELAEFLRVFDRVRDRSLARFLAVRNIVCLLLRSQITI